MQTMDIGPLVLCTCDIT